MNSILLLLVFVLLFPLTISALELVRSASDGSKFVSFLLVFLGLVGFNFVIFSLAVFFIRYKRQNIRRSLGQNLQYNLLDFDNIENDWQMVTEKRKSKPVETTTERKRKGLFALKKEVEEKKEKSLKS